MKIKLFFSVLVAFMIQASMVFGATKIIYVVHGADTDTWWNTIKNAVKEGAADMKADVEYRNAPTADPTEMVPLMEAAIAQNPDGIVVSIPDANVLGGVIEKAVRKGIPVISINTGADSSKKLGALMHVGQPEYAAGKGAGERAVKEGAGKKFLCVNHEIVNTALEDRCQGFADALGVKNNMLDTGADPAEVENRVKAYLRKNPEITTILATGPTGTEPTLRALKGLNRNDIYLATFDLSDGIAAGIEAGTVKFAIDQQPYLQGYIPIVVIDKLTKYGVLPGNSINSGPGFITKDNIAQVKELAGKYR